MNAKEFQAQYGNKKPRASPQKNIQSTSEQMAISDRTVEEEIMSRLFLKYEGYVGEYPDHFRISYKGKEYMLKPIAIK